MTCRACGRAVEEGARFCAHCGTPVSETCRACGAELAAAARFCSACGAPTDALDGRPGDAPARERKLATILFADIVGYTGLTESRDPELVQSLVSDAFARLSAEVDRYQGYVEKFAGDAMLALFGVPQAHEDDAERAVRAALEMQAAFAEPARRQTSGRPQLELRIGIETGEVLVDLARVGGARDRLVTGDAVNTAARLQAAAAPGTIVVGPGTYGATRELVEYEELPPLELKGKSSPVPGWRAVRVRARRGGRRAPLGLEAPLIGRDEELSLLKETARRMTADGRPHLVTVVGAPGVGKSRLLWELEKYLDGLPEIYHWRKGRYLSYGQVSFGGLVELVRSDAGVADDETEADWRLRMDERVAALGLAGDEPVERALAVLLGAGSDAAVSRDDLFEAWRRYLEAIARRAPLVVVLEDVHWADDGSLDFVDFVARWAEAPILLVCLARHELLERRPSWGGGVANSSTIELEPLAASENGALLDALLPGSLPARFKDRIVAVAEGNPLFSEELVRMLIDRGIARRGADGWDLIAPVDELEIPSSIHALLAARLDSLPAAEKRVTQAAAVVGRIFWDAVLAHVVAGAHPELDRLLRGLRVKELVVPREPSSLSGSREYGFRHVLIRDVAYESVPKVDRAEKHLRVARWAEERLAAREDELIELLATHYRSALAYREEALADEHDLRELRRSVLEHARRAGRRARELWQAATAAHWFRVAVEQARRLELPPLEQAPIVLEYLDVAIWSERPEDALAVARPAAEMVEPAATSDADALSLLALIQTHIGYFVYETGRAEEARSVFEAALRRLADGPPSAARARLLWRLGWVNWRAFSAGDAVPILERAVDEARSTGATDTERQAVHDLGVALAYSGRSAEGLALLERSVEMARDAADQALMMRGSINLPALMSNVSWEVERGHAIARDGLERARRGGHRFFVAFLASNLGEGAADEGRFDEAMSLLAEARTVAEELQNENLIGLAYGFTAGAYARFGRFDEAARWWAEAERHGADEPQGAGRSAVLHALLEWPTDPRAAVTNLARGVAGTVGTPSAARALAAMAARTGQADVARAALAAMDLERGTPRLDADAEWREALLDPPTAEAAETIARVAQSYLDAGQLLVAADGFADAAHVARSAGLPVADDIQRRSDELYARCGARPLLAPAGAPDQSTVGPPAGGAA